MFECTFKQAPDAKVFTAHNEALAYLHARGFSVGATQAHAPSGVLYGEYVIAKWRNLTRADRSALDGEVTGDFRNGPVSVSIWGPRAEKASGPATREPTPAKGLTFNEACERQERLNAERERRL